MVGLLMYLVFITIVAPPCIRSERLRFPSSTPESVERIAATARDDVIVEQSAHRRSSSSPPLRHKTARLGRRYRPEADRRSTASQAQGRRDRINVFTKRL